ncbi:MAG: EthD family reductase [Pseudomonadota bacterium]
MIRVTLLYQKSKGTRFDFDYYVNHHVTMSRRLLADCGLRSIEVEKVASLMDGSPSDLHCITHVDFEDEACLTKALTLHGEEMMADFVNYTDIEPEIHICEVLTTGI